MTIVAIFELAALALIVYLGAGMLRAQQRAHARREDLLLNQLLHATGHTWTPPPATAADVDRDDEEQAAPRYIPPDQLPVY